MRFLFMALKVQSTIDYLFAFGIAFFLTLLVFGAVLEKLGTSRDSVVFYLAVALVAYSVEFFFVLRFLSFTEKFEKKKVAKKQGK